MQAEARAGRPVPTLREIAARFGFRSHRAAACHLEALRRKGFVESERGKARSLRITSPLAKLRRLVTDIPLFGSIPAGFGQDREQVAEGCISVDVHTLGFQPTRHTFALRVVGDSMIGRHICEGDIVILEHGPEPRHGQIVAALVDRKSTGTTSWATAWDLPYEKLARDYAIVARIYDNTTGQPVIIAAGISEEGTEAAGEILYNPVYLDSLLAKAPPDWTKKNMEAVIETQVIQGHS